MLRVNMITDTYYYLDYPSYVSII